MILYSRIHLVVGACLMVFLSGCVTSNRFEVDTTLEKAAVIDRTAGFYFVVPADATIDERHFFETAPAALAKEGFRIVDAKSADYVIVARAQIAKYKGKMEEALAIVAVHKVLDSKGKYEARSLWEGTVYVSMSQIADPELGFRALFSKIGTTHSGDVVRQAPK